MSKFRIEAPDGKVFDVEGPDGATAEQALAQVVHVRARVKPADAEAVLARRERGLGEGGVV